MNDQKNTYEAGQGYPGAYNPEQGVSTPRQEPSAANYDSGGIPQHYRPHNAHQTHQAHQTYMPMPPHHAPANPVAAYQRYNSYGPYEPYRYSPGWTQPPRHAPHPQVPPREPAPPVTEMPRYEWKLSDYDPYDPAKKQRKRGGGFVIFTVCLLLTFSLGVVSLVAMGLLGGFMPFAPDAPISAPAYTGDEAAPGVPPDEPAPSSEAEPRGGESVQLILGERPPSQNVVLPGGRMTIPDVAEFVKPSVVSVVKYADQRIEPVGIASGIILSENGYIVTNAHVVHGGTDFKIYIYNGDPYDASVIGVDDATDLAVLKIEATGLTPATFGDSDALRVGETVIAIGNPVNLNLAGSVTQGIVSALDRSIDQTRHSINYIQTDAAINPGSSGGALVNEYGQVIGINVAKIAATGYEGLCFAIPSSAALPIIEDLLRYGRVTGRVKIGIEGRAIDEFDARRNSLRPGVMIQGIDGDSDLNGKDVQRQDIITHINGERILIIPDIHAILDNHEVGDIVTLTIFRRTRNSDITFDLEIRLVEDKSGYAPR